jgi:membrane-associated phospholipid phosphatase
VTTDRVRQPAILVTSAIIPLAVLMAGNDRPWVPRHACAGELLAVHHRRPNDARPPVPKLDVFPPMQRFPSGHTAAAVALYGGIAVILAMHVQTRMQKVAWWAVLLIVPVAVSLIYRGMHYPSDVIASFIIGLGCLWILKRAILTPAGSGRVSA